MYFDLFLKSFSVFIRVLMKLEIRGEMTELADGARLEIVCSAKSGTEGSNPSLSAKKHNWTRMNTDSHGF